MREDIEDLFSPKTLILYEDGTVPLTHTELFDPSCELDRYGDNSVNLLALAGTVCARPDEDMVATAVFRKGERSSRVGKFLGVFAMAGRAPLLRACDLPPCQCLSSLATTSTHVSAVTLLLSRCEET
jgi:hypothetical protein